MNENNGIKSNGIKNNGIKVPYRGDIIVDACALLHLCVDIPKDGYDPAPRKFLSLLPFLAKNGYHIIIPEMVSYEMGQILASGFDVGSLFDKKSRKPAYDILKPFLKDAALPESSPYKENPNIEMRSATGPEEVDIFLQSMEKIVKNHQKRAEYLKKRVVLNYTIDKEGVKAISGNATHHEIANLEKMKKPGCSGDDAIISLAGKYYEQKDNKPVFVLTDDNSLIKTIINKFPATKKFPGVNIVTASNLIYSLVGAGLSADAGFPVSFPAVDLNRKRMEFLEKMKGEKKVITDKLHFDEDGYNSFIKSLPFFKSLEGLAEDLKKQKEKEANVNAGECNGSGRAEKFRKKYGQSTGYNKGDMGVSL